MAYWDRDLATMLRADLGGLKPQEAAAGTVTSAWLDRRSPRASDSMPNVYDALLVEAMTGAVGGGGTNPSVVFSVLDADDASGTNALAYTPPNSTTAAAITLSGQTGSNSARLLAVDLSAARRYVQVQAVVSVTGGGATLGVAAGVALGAPRQNPA